MDGSSSWRAGRRVLVFVAVFVVAILLGRASRLAGSEIALVWPAAAVAAVWMLWVRSRRERVVSAFALGASCAITSYVTGAGAGLSAGFAVTNLIIGWGTAALLDRRGDVRLREPVDLAWMVASVAATTGVAALVGAVLLHELSQEPFGESLFIVWTRNGVTTLLGVTLYATFPRSVLRRVAAFSLPEGRRLVGDLVVWVVAMAVYAGVFVVNVGEPVAYFALPVGVLIALRWSTAVCVAHLLASDVFVLSATALGRGPFVGAEPIVRAVLAQGLIGCALMVVLTVALYRDSRDRLMRGLNDAHRDLQQAAVQLRRSALHDPLTGLANRQQLMDVLAHELDRAADADSRVGVVFLDLNGFKAVNDRWGHAEGDLLLDAVATRLRAFLRAGDSVARLGGDEFVMVCPGLSAPGQLELIATRLAEHLRQPYHLPSGQIHDEVSASLGTAQSTRESTAEQMLRDADTEMYVVKRRHRTARTAAATAPR